MIKNWSQRDLDARAANTDLTPADWQTELAIYEDFLRLSKNFSNFHLQSELQGWLLDLERARIVMDKKRRAGLALPEVPGTTSAEKRHDFYRLGLARSALIARVQSMIVDGYLARMLRFNRRALTCLATSLRDSTKYEPSINEISRWSDLSCQDGVCPVSDLLGSSCLAPA